MDSHTPRKRFGQNFLINPAIIAQIVAEINPQPAQDILEIGPGHGALTHDLLASKANITAVEIDRNLTEFLNKKFSHAKNFKLYCEDILQFSLHELKAVQQGKKIRVVGNLPYNISTPLLFKLFADIVIISDMFFMLQHEVAMRLIANPGSKDYGRLSVMAQYYCNMQIVCAVPPEAFDPQPQVDSNIVRFIPRRHSKQDEVDTTLLQNIVSQAFNQRRKTIANSLKNLFSSQELQQHQIDPQLRAEDISLTQYLILTKYLQGRT